MKKVNYGIVMMVMIGSLIIIGLVILGAPSFAQGKTNIKSIVVTEENKGEILQRMQLSLYGMSKDIPIKDMQYFISYVQLEDNKVVGARISGADYKPNYYGKTVGWIIEQGKKDAAKGKTLFPEKTGKKAVTKNQTKPASSKVKKPADNKSGVKLVPAP